MNVPHAPVDVEESAVAARVREACGGQNLADDLGFRTLATVFAVTRDGRATEPAVRAAMDVLY